MSRLDERRTADRLRRAIGDEPQSTHRETGGSEDALRASGETYYQEAFTGAKAQLDAMPGALYSIFAHVAAILTCAAASVATTLDMAPGTVQVVPFGVGMDDGEFRALASSAHGSVKVTALRPNGAEMSPSALQAGEAFSDNPTYAHALLSGTNPTVAAVPMFICISP